MEQPYTDSNAGLHYDLQLEIDPKINFVAVAGSLAYHSPYDKLERARFYLHRQFLISRLEGRRVLGYHFDTPGEPDKPQLPQAGVLDVYFNPPLSHNETALIQFEYQGTITEWPAESANIITPDWAELGQSLPWFPFQFNGQPSDLTFTLRVQAPVEYQVGSLGSYTFDENSWYFNWPHPTSDIVIVAGPSLEPRQFESQPNRVFLSSATFGEIAAKQLGEDMLWTLERFSGWFGPTRPTDFTLIESPRPLGGSYARRGLIVLGGINEQDYLSQREAYLRYLAHEAAHAWWWEAPANTWEDWLNEGFAEYSALLALRERFGDETFERFLERKRERVSGLPPIWELDRKDTDTPEKQATVDRLLYDKGPWLLNNLAQRIGYQRFLELCRAMLWSGVTQTQHFLDLLEEVEDHDARVWIENQLKT